VRDVWVGGEQVIVDGRSARLDESELFDEAASARQALLDRAAITIPRAWPHRDAR
jgi:hypothetical protein